MTEKIIQQSNKFTETVDDEIREELIKPEDNELTNNISSIHSSLWKNYKVFNGISAGFHGISEYIVFSTFKSFIENLNKPQKFNCQKINEDLRYFEMERNNKFLGIYRASSLGHFPDDAKTQLFMAKSKLRAPDIAILKKEANNFNLIAIIEIKNYLDRWCTDSGLGMLSQIREAVKNNYTKYALFSFGSIAVRNAKTIEELNKFQNKENNFLITLKRRNEEFDVIDLSEFLNIIKDELIL